MLMSNRFLDEYQPAGEWAAEHGVHLRTVDRYRQQANGLPYLEFGGRIFIPRKEADEWIRARIRRPNRSRGRPRKVEAAGMAAST
jgi:hypothetical protein